jgi:hypothetical protein
LDQGYGRRTKSSREERDMGTSSRPKDKNVIGTKWVFRNKLNEDGDVTVNKARLVCK